MVKRFLISLFIVALSLIAYNHHWRSSVYASGNYPPVELGPVVPAGGHWRGPHADGYGPIIYPSPLGGHWRIHPDSACPPYPICAYASNKSISLVSHPSGSITLRAHFTDTGTPYFTSLFIDNTAGDRYGTDSWTGPTNSSGTHDQTISPLIHGDLDTWCFQSGEASYDTGQSCYSFIG